jgi:predicted RNase H-like nuclease (RuvC/YqgF family)
MTGRGKSRKKKMEHLKIPLTDAEEAILGLMKKVHRLEAENQSLKDENQRLRQSIQENDSE